MIDNSSNHFSFRHVLVAFLFNFRLIIRLRLLVVNWKKGLFVSYGFYFFVFI